MLLSRRDLAHAHHVLRRSMRDAESTRKMTSNVVRHTVDALEVGVSAFGFGVLKGRWPTVSVGPVPIDLLSALGLYGLAFSGLAGDAGGDHLANFAHGALASFGNALGAGVGKGWLEDATKNSPPGAKPAATTAGVHDPRSHLRHYARTGALPAAQRPLTAAELAAMAHAVR